MFENGFLTYRLLAQSRKGVVIIMDDMNKNTPQQDDFEALLKKITEETNNIKITQEESFQLVQESDSSFDEPEKVSKPAEKFQVNISNEELMSIPDTVNDLEDSYIYEEDYTSRSFSDDAPTKAINLDDVKKEIQRENKKEKKAKTSSAIIYILCVVLVSVLASLFIITSARDIFGLAKPNNEYTLNVSNDTKVSDVSKQLKKIGVISLSGMFDFYTSLRYDVENFKSGEYVLNSNMSYDEIIIKLAKGTGTYETVKVTIPEGYNVNQVAKLLEENGVCSAKAFREACKKTYGFEFEEGISDKTYYHLEGYIFPNTHEFYVGEKPESVVKRFLRDFQQNVMISKYTERMEEMGMTLNETLALASVIQKEASTLEDMYKVSSVFHNRLKDNHIFPKLQSDVTYYYAQDEVLAYMDIKDEVLANGYNTYDCDGLPVGAITNPGIDAIRAALYPDETNYYYFVGVTVGEGENEREKFYFASTMSAHEYNIYLASKEGNAHGTTTQK